MADELTDGEALRWLRRIDESIEGLRRDVAEERRENAARYVTSERHALEVEALHAEIEGVRGEIRDLQDSAKWTLRTAVGAVVAVIVSIVTQWIRLKAGP